MRVFRIALMAAVLALAGPAGADPSSDQNFARDVVAASQRGPVVAYFQAEWCAQCKAMLPQMERAVAAHGGLRLVVVDADAAPRAAKQLRITSLPAVVGYSGGGPNEQLTASDLNDVQLTRFLDRVAGSAR